MDTRTATLARAVAAEFDEAVRRQVERLIRGGDAPRRFAIDAALAVALASMIIAVLQMVQTALIAGEQKNAEALRRRIVLEIVPPPGVSQETMEKLVRAAVDAALTSPE